VDPAAAVQPISAGKQAAQTKPAVSQAGAPKMVPVEFKMPREPIHCVPKNFKPRPTLDENVDKDRPPFMVPEGTTNLALHKPATSSTAYPPIIGLMELVTDGSNSWDDGEYVVLERGLQWVQIDLQQPAVLYAIALWHYGVCERIYHDVVIQASDDPNFKQDVRLIYNNDFDNSSGLGLGKDLEYVEDYRGRIIDAKGIQGRYVRLYSNGNTDNDENQYIEVMVFGKPVTTEARTN
jgi:hypothetical protein